MDINKAVALEIGKFERPAITAYQMALIVFNLYKTKKYGNEKLNHLKKGFPTRQDYSRIIKKLKDSGVLQNSYDLPSYDAYVILGQNLSSAEEAICCIDPFCYISHLSAMEYHGLTDRFSKTIFVSSPTPSKWKQLAQEKMEKDTGGHFKQYLDTNLPLLSRMWMSKILRKTISAKASVHFDSGAYVSVQGKPLRVSSIGRTFLDMIHDPDLCGGIYHVLDVFAENAERYLRLITDEVQQHGSSIDKVRMGYILDERLNLSDPHIKKWKASVQRGGSRKLVANNPYAPHFSEKWALSINIEELQEKDRVQA